MNDAVRAVRVVQDVVHGRERGVREGRKLALRVHAEASREWAVICACAAGPFLDRALFVIQPRLLPRLLIVLVFAIGKFARVGRDCAVLAVSCTAESQAGQHQKGSAALVDRVIVNDANVSALYWPNLDGRDCHDWTRNLA